MTKTTKLKFGIAGVGAALLAIAGFATLAGAAVAPDVALTIRNSGGAVITSADVGDQVRARAVVSSSATTTEPTGTVDFRSYANQSCSGTPTVQTGVVLDADGIASSSLLTVAAGGLSYRAHYNGVADIFTEVDSACVSIDVDEDDNDTSLSISLSDSNVTEGSSVYAIPTLIGETAGADGTISYKVYNNNSCTDLERNAGSKSVTNGVTQNSNSETFNTADTYYWQAVYSGDDANEAATSSCVVLTVTSDDDDDTSDIDGQISGTVFNDENNNGKQDSGEEGIAGIKVWLHKASGENNSMWNKMFRKAKAKNLYNAPIIATATTDSNGNYSFDDLSAGIYFVEEDEPSDWDQRSSDRKVVLKDEDDSADVDFANVAKNDEDEDNDDDNGRDRGDRDDRDKGDKDNDNNGRGHDKDKKNGKDNGNHYGWTKGWGNIWKNR